MMSYQIGIVPVIAVQSARLIARVPTPLILKQFRPSRAVSTTPSRWVESLVNAGSIEERFKYVIPVTEDLNAIA